MATAGSDLTEIEIIQNPALGSYLLWVYGRAFQNDHETPSPVLLAFLVLPLLLHKPTVKLITSTYKRSGLSLFAGKFAENREDLLAVQARAAALRPLTLQSISIGASARLLTVNYETGALRANQLDDGLKAPSLPERLKALPAAAEKLGHWFATSGLHQVATTLRVEF
jgi:hypothetical protein